MEYCPGSFVDDVDYMRKHNIDLAGVSKKISQVITLHISVIYALV